MRFSKYNIYTETDKGLVIYNLRTAKYVNIFKEPELSYIKNLISSEELPEDDNIIKALYKQGYVVNDNDSEYERLKNEIINSLREDSEVFISITVFVTDNCNLRCVYCPQEHKQNVFSDESWEALYKYLEKNVISGKLRFINVSFFGGEPLLRSNQIISFLTKMKELSKTNPDLQTIYNMTTNGYLLTPDLYDKLAELGITEFQITLDGFAEIHNQSRPLADGSPTWDTIVKNFDYINTKDDDVVIQLRSNINDINRDSMNDFIKWIDKKYKKEKFLITFQPVTQIGDKVNKDYVDENEKSFKEVVSVQTESDRSFNNDNVDFLGRLGLACRYAANYFAITTDANIYKCEYTYLDIVKSVGYLSDDGDFVFNDEYSKWTENLETEDCKNCMIYPICGARYCIKKNANGLYTHSHCMEKQEAVVQLVNDLIKDGTISKYM